MKTTVPGMGDDSIVVTAFDDSILITAFEISNIWYDNLVNHATATLSYESAQILRDAITEAIQRHDSELAKEIGEQ